MVMRIAVIVAAVTLATPAKAGICETYRAVAEESDIVAGADLMRWANYALRGEGIYAENARCVVYISVLSMSVTSKAGQNLGWVATIHLSTRRFTQQGQIMGDEDATLFTAEQRESLAGSLRDSIEKFIAGKLKRPVRPAAADAAQPASATP
jgi:hypothetical protein